jgi:RNA polymerase sigma factor for flagellar operon FliA
MLHISRSVVPADSEFVPPAEHELICTYDTRIRQAAHAVARACRYRVPVEDLLQIGRLALLEQARRYQHHRGVPFDAWVTAPLRARMIDALPRYTGVARVAANQRYLLEHPADPDATVAECLAHHLQALSPNARRRRMSWQAIARSLHAHGDIVDATCGSVDQLLEPLHIQRLLLRLCQRLPHPTREVIRAHYFSDESLHQIAARLHISPSWVSRVHREGLACLYQMLRPFPELQPGRRTPCGLHDQRLALARRPRRIRSRSLQAAGIAHGKSQGISPSDSSSTAT